MVGPRWSRLQLVIHLPLRHFFPSPCRYLLALAIASLAIGAEAAEPNRDLDAALLVISVCRHAPTKAHLALVRAHLAAGKPLIGIRSASHAFGLKPKDDRHGGWMTFDQDVIGGSYAGHYGDVPALLALAPGAATHPLLEGVDPARISAQRLYKNLTLVPTATALLLGRSQGASEDQHVAWVNQVGKSRVFYTSLGTVRDFAKPDFRRLLTNAVFWALERPRPQP